MSQTEGLQVRTPRLTQFGGELETWADQARAIGQTLGGVLADTGRPDSDEAGRLAAQAAAEVLATQATALTTNGGHVRICATNYASCDLFLSEEYAAVERIA